MSWRSCVRNFARSISFVMTGYIFPSLRRRDWQRLAAPDANISPTSGEVARGDRSCLGFSEQVIRELAPILSGQTPPLRARKFRHCESGDRQRRRETE